MINVINNTTFEIPLLGGEKVEVGDRNSSDFKPHVKLNRWGGECFIKASLPTDEKPNPAVMGDKIAWKSDKITAQFYGLDRVSKDGFIQNELGGFEFEIVLNNKPPTNQITLQIETKGLEFFYQPELTQEEIDSGCVRPENVVGSYAVYHATKKGVYSNPEEAEKYKCGKAFHIYRPKVTDNSGKSTWASLNIDSNILTITIDQEWLDNAEYPVTIDPNFGCETVGASDVNLENYLNAGQYNCPEAGTGVSITARIKTVTSVYGTKCCLYAPGSPSSPITNGGTGELYIPADTEDWRTFNFPTGPTLANQDYNIVVWSHGAAGYCYAKYDSSAGDTRRAKYSLYNGWPSDVAWTTYDDSKLSIYCTYSVGGVTHYGSGTLSGVGTLAGAGRLILSGKGTLHGEGALSGLGRLILAGKGTLSGVGSLVGKGRLILAGKGTLSGEGFLSGKGTVGQFIKKLRLHPFAYTRRREI